MTCGASSSSIFELQQTIKLAKLTIFLQGRDKFTSLSYITTEVIGEVIAFKLHKIFLSTSIS